MKNLFTLPLEEGKGSSFEKYIVKNISKETENEINEMNVRINEFQKQYKRIFSKISSILLLISTFCFIVGIFSIKGNITYAILGFVGFVLSLGLSFLCIFLEYRQSKKIQTSEEYLKLNNDAEEIIKKAYKELGVEKNNNGVDVYLYYYIEKNGKITSGLPYKSLMVKEYVLYKDEEYFYLGDVYNVVRLPLPSIRGLSKHDNQFSFYGWSKKDSFLLQSGWFVFY